MNIIFLIIGLLVGLLFRNKIVTLFNSLVVVYKHDYKVKFSVYFAIHKNGSEVNEIVKSESVEIVVRAKDEDEVISFVDEYIENHIKVEIQTIDRV
jgi:hypothetical protein